MMPTTYRIIITLTILCKFVFSQGIVGDVCTIESSGTQGECKLVGDCPDALTQLQKHNRHPQTCGFEGITPIVCCPKSENHRTPGEISKRKCKEYAQYAFERAPVLLLVEPNIERNQCAHRTSSLLPSNQPRRKEFPHMAAIGFEDTPGKIQWLCSGAILSSEYVLIAAHCLYSQTYGDAKWVKIGVTDLKDTNHVQQIKVASLIPYPEYRTSSYYHDIGLIKLEKPATLNRYARPACLYSKPYISTERAFATGWERIDSWGGQNGDDDYLLKVALDLFDHDFCNASYKNQISKKLKNGIVNDIQLCAGLRNEKDCQGYSNGPLQIYHDEHDAKCMYDIVGVASFGKICSSSQVYTRVSHYVKWIEDIVWP